MNEEMRKGDLAPGTVIGGKYEILGVSGRGGMSTIYRARDKKVGRICAVKQITDRDRESCERHKMSLLTERELLAGLTNPRIPRITDIVEDEGESDFFYVVMDFLEGENLQHYLSRTGPQQEEQVVAWAKTLCGILKYLHTTEREREAIIFRDVKPGNIMLRRDGDLALFDFGIAAETEDGSLVNEDVAFTPGYAAPEQMVRGARIDQRTDIYGLGATIFALLSGETPLENENPARIKALVPDIFPGLQEIIERCMAKDPEDRYQSCAELENALAHWTETEADRRRRAGRRLLIFGAVTAGAVVSFFAAGASFYIGTRQKMHLYSELITSADAAANDTYDVQGGKYRYDPQVVNRFMEAIDADPAGKDAYEKLLDYCAAAGMPEVGLMRVTANIDAGIVRNDELIFKVARMYFAGVQVPGDGYREAARYFSMVDAVRIPVAAYYRKISAVLGQYNALSAEDWRGVAADTAAFEAYLDSQNRPLMRVNGYMLTGGLYRANEASFADAGTDADAEAIRLYEKALAQAEDFLENADLKGSPPSELAEAEKMRTGALENLGALYLLDTPHRDLVRSEECYVALLAGTTDPEAMKQYRFRLAVVYREMGDDAKVQEWYEYLMEEYSGDPEPFLEYAGYLYSVRRDAEAAVVYFKAAAALPGAESVRNYRVLENNLKNAGAL